MLGESWLDNLDAIRLEGAVDLLCITGDIADWGQPEEYAAASEFVEATRARLGLDSDRVFIVPGNHDVARLVARETWQKLRELIPKSDPLAISRWMAGIIGAPPGLVDAWRDEILLRQSAYRDWVRSVHGDELLPAHSPHGRLGYRATLSLPHLPFPVHVIGLDTAWLAGDDADAGHLLLTPHQILSLCTDGRGKRLPGVRLALMHHPLSDLADGDASRNFLAQYTDVVLRGHLHHSRVETLDTPDGRLPQLAAGSMYEGWGAALYRNGCELITIELDELGSLRGGELRYRSWSPEGHWHDDGSIYRSAPNGRLAWVAKHQKDADVTTAGISIANRLLSLLEETKEHVRKRDVSLHTPHLWLALLRSKPSFAAACLERFSPGSAAHLERAFSSAMVALTPASGRFVEVRWSEREDIKNAYRAAAADGAAFVDERYLLLGLLTTPSNTTLQLRQKYGADGIQHLVELVRNTKPDHGTPFLDL
ncbi:uncharacterized protein SOCE836_054470 [Sorangium cellulosum]|uniref:Calcineurin-like phosphoesterase domain-containing protein n=1 Tax=Sorangium cellulosum TaxID=56 RepID=A0A4V0NGI5_SORCE|nr:uncharacterized protein SOCE836_054470 [Sorangium cellulosum]WCQ92607.1 3',5'-cyclic adenosine monophosphate phosphodiesterase CpdA [Sorangium sp. Soce836]